MDSRQAGEGPAATLKRSPLPERYRLLEQVAVGGMGSVWVADDRLLGRHVAIKLLAEQLASQPLFVKRFEREARTAAALSGHPNVITIYDVGEHDGRPFIVMAYLPGGTVRDRIKAGHVRHADAIEWIHDAADGLDFAHASDVVHRDVKPQNLLFDGRGRVVVADLGIARAAYEDSLTASGELLGTASYIAPEQAMGDAATAASDRYSLAVVAYELLTGGRPFEGASFAEQALQQVESQPDPPSMRAPELSPEVDAVLLKGLAKDPAKRWESAGAFAAALAEAIEDEPPSPQPRIDPERSWPHEPTTATYFRRVRRRAGPIAAVLLVALAIAGGVLVFTGGDDGSGTGNGGSSAERSPAKKAKAKSKAQTNAKTKGSGGEAAPAQTTPSTTPPSTSTPSTTTPSTQAPAGASPASLNDQGYALMNSGRYDDAIPLLQRAVAAFPADSTDLTLAYALYNLGRSLRLAGRPSEAVPYLERRLRFANQRGVVRRELAAARAAAG
jgi:eukaryotic-like serine/threonine-protein kinase